MFRRKSWRPPPLKLPGASAIDSGSAEWPSLDSPTFSHYASDDEDSVRRRQKELRGAHQQVQEQQGGSSSSSHLHQDHGDEKPQHEQMTMRARTTPVLPKLKLGKINREPLQQLEPPVNSMRPEPPMATTASTTERGNARQVVPPLAVVPALVLEDHTALNGASTSSSEALKGTNKLSVRRRPPPSSSSSSPRQGSPKSSSRKGTRGQQAPGPVVPELPLKEEPRRPRSTRLSKTPRGSMPRLSLGRLLTPRGRRDRDSDPDAAALESRRPSTARAPSRRHPQQEGMKEEGAKLRVSGTPRGGGVPGLGPLMRLLTPRGSSGGSSGRRHPLPWGHKGSSSSSGRAAAGEAAAAAGGGVLMLSSSPSEAASSALEAMRSPDGPEQLRGAEALAELVQDPAGCEAASTKGAVRILAGLLCAAEAEAKAAHGLLLLSSKAPGASGGAACDAAALHPAAVPALEALVLLLPGSVENRGALRSWRSSSSDGGGGGRSSGASEGGGGEALRCLVRLLGAPEASSGSSKGQQGLPHEVSSWQPPPRAQFLALLAVRVMTEHEGDRQAVHGAGGVPALLRLLADGASPMGIRENAAGALGNLAAGAGNVKAALRGSGAVPLLVGLLEAPHHPRAEQGGESQSAGGGAEGDVLAEFACGALMNMSLRNLPNRQAILEAGGLEPLLRHLSAGQEVLRDSWDCRVQMVDGAVHPATVSFDLSQGHMLVTPRPRGRPQRGRSLFTPRAPRGPASASSPGSSSLSFPGAATHVYSMLSKFKMVEPHPGALEMRFESDAASTGGRRPYCGLAPLRSHHHQGSSSFSPSGSSLTLSCVVLQPCPADDVRSAVLKMMTRVHMEREFRSSSGSSSAPVASSRAAEAPSAEAIKSEEGGVEEVAAVAAQETEKETEKAAVAPPAASLLTKSLHHQDLLEGSSVFEDPLQERMVPSVQLQQRIPDASPSSSSCSHAASTSSASGCSPVAPNDRQQQHQRQQRILGKGNAADHRLRYPTTSTSSTPSSVSVTSGGGRSSASTATSGSAPTTAALPLNLSLGSSRGGASEAEQDDSAGVFFSGGVFAYGSAAAGSCRNLGTATVTDEADDGVLVGSPEASPPRVNAEAQTLPRPPSPCHLPIPVIALDGLLHAGAAAAAESVAAGSPVRAAAAPQSIVESNGGAVGLGARGRSTSSGGVRPPLGRVTSTVDTEPPQVTPELQIPALSGRGRSDSDEASRAAATECLKSIAAAAAVLSTDGGRAVRVQRYSSLRRRQSLIPSYSDSKGARGYARSQSAPRSRARPASAAAAAASAGPASPPVDTRRQQQPAMMGLDPSESSPVLNLPPYNPAQPSTFLLGSALNDDGHHTESCGSVAPRRLSLHSHDPTQPTPSSCATSGRPGMAFRGTLRPTPEDPAAAGSPTRPPLTTPPTSVARLDFDCLLRLDEQEAPETPGSWLKQPRAQFAPS